MKQKFFTTGRKILATGIYRVKHRYHELPNEVLLHKGQQFPGCSKCNAQVLFELIHAAPDAFSDSDFRVAPSKPQELPASAQPESKSRTAV
jgi:hypothetical protein